MAVGAAARCGICRVDTRRRAAARAVRDRTGCLERSSAGLPPLPSRSLSRARRRPSSSPRGRPECCARVDRRRSRRFRRRCDRRRELRTTMRATTSDRGSSRVSATTCASTTTETTGRRPSVETGSATPPTSAHLPVVGAARAARLWGLWDPVDQVGRESLERATGLAVRRHRYGTGDAHGGIAVFVILRRANRAIGGLVGLVLMVTTVALTTLGNTRFRTTAEPALLIGVAAVVHPVGSSRLGRRVDAAGHVFFHVRRPYRPSGM